MLLERLSIQTRRSQQQLVDFAFSAGRKYKVYDIPKRSGGFRTIEQPSRSVKLLQKLLVNTLFDRYPIHPSATAYISGKSIRDNASIHASFSFTIRMDFSDIFLEFQSR